FTFFVFFHAYVSNLHLHSFPTRRSSDLMAMLIIFKRVSLCCFDEACFSLLPLAQRENIDYNSHKYIQKQDKGVTCHMCYDDNARSEEHTSELQSRGHLVCRLLLEKKKTN